MKVTTEGVNGNRRIGRQPPNEVRGRLDHVDVPFVADIAAVDKQIHTGREFRTSNSQKIDNLLLLPVLEHPEVFSPKISNVLSGRIFHHEMDYNFINIGS